MSFAFIEFEYDELPSVEGSPVTGIKGYLLPASFLLSFQLAVFAMILLFEYLRGHIGEKRLSEDTIVLEIPFNLVFFNDSLNRAVVFVQPVRKVLSKLLVYPAC